VAARLFDRWPPQWLRRNYLKGRRIEIHFTKLARAVRLTAILVALAAAALAAVYFYNGRCFACDSESGENQCNESTISACSVQNARLDSRVCTVLRCQNCNTCNNDYMYTCCAVHGTCMDDAHLGNHA
jgi:hypothetical protein